MDYDRNLRLLELRHALSLTQKEFGEKIHISKGYVTSLEKGRQPLNERIIKLLSDTYGVSSEWLKNGTGAMFYDPEKSQINEIIYTFNRLNPDFQNFIINQLRSLSKINHNYRPGTQEIMGVKPKEKRPPKKKNKDG